MSLRSSSQQPPVLYAICDRLQTRIEPSRRICRLRAVPLGHVADESFFARFGPVADRSNRNLRSDPVLPKLG